MITGYDLVNEYYEDEKLYSTGDDYLDDLLERAFCDGYEYAQREYAEKEENEESEEETSKNKKKSVGKKIAKGVGLTAAGLLTAAGIYQGQHAIRGKRLDKKIAAANSYGTNRDELLNRRAKLANEFGVKFGKEKIDEPMKKAAHWTSDKAKDFGRWVGKQFKKKDIKTTTVRRPTHS